MTASIKEGARAAARHPKLVLLVWASYGLLALVPVAPAWTWWNRVLGPSPEAASVLRRFDLGVFLDLTRGGGTGGLGLLTTAAAAAGLLSLISSAFVFGGVLEALGTDSDRRSFMHRFFRGGGHFFWRFVRLGFVAVVCLVLAVAAVAALMTAVTSPLRDSEWEPASYLASLARLVVLALVAGFFLLGLDYARIRVASEDSRRMLRAYASGIAFVARHVLAVYGMAAVVVAALVALLALYVAYETEAPAAGTWAAILLLFLIQQVVVLGRVFLRVALVGAERHFHAAVSPKPAPAIEAGFPAAGEAGPAPPAQSSTAAPAEWQTPT